MADTPEISDLIVAYDPETLERVPVRRDEVVARFSALGCRGAARQVARIPAPNGVLDPAAVDALLVEAHLELQRLNEEFLVGHRVLEVLRPALAALRAADAPRPLRIVDVGCGLGYMSRWLAACGELGADVELVGCDYNAALIARAEALAEREGLSCRFVVGNAFTLAEPAAIYTSTGVLHHFRDADLEAFFARQRGARAFFHFDIERSWLAPVGAWLFHQARMRSALARNDGVRSALRAHGRAELLAAARAGAAGLRTAFFRVASPLFPIVRTMRPIVGIEQALWEPWLEGLGPRRKLVVEQA